MNNKCIFCEIAEKKSATNIIYEDEEILAFDDIFPKAPIHKLIIPKKHFATLNDISAKDAHLLTKMMMVAKKMAIELNISERGYRVILNCNHEGGQRVYHIHLHLIGGKELPC